MITKDEVENIIRAYIENTEKLGELAGGSGHMSSVSYDLTEFHFKCISDENLLIKFKYIISTVTEFTYYPDNPPMEVEFEKEITVNKLNEIIEEKIISSKDNFMPDDMMDPFWQEDKDRILNFIEELLAKIEWKYGENRAPIKYPPEFCEKEGVFLCKVELEDDGGELDYKDESSKGLADKVIDDLRDRFYPN